MPPRKKMIMKTSSGQSGKKLRLGSKKRIRTVRTTTAQVKIGGKVATVSARGRRTPAFFSKRYKLIAPVGKGGAGLVYKAHDTMLDMNVAIKFMPERFTRDPTSLSRFKQEASIAMQLSHENIVKLHNLEMSKNRMFMVMELVDGSDFRTILRENRTLALSTVVQIIGSCALALDYAHECGVCHQDLKPENLMLTAESTLKIIDYGTANRFEIGAEPEAEESEWIEGSPPYMSPEQILGDALDHRTDIYSLGIIAYELIAGYPPFSLNTDFEAIVKVQPAPPEGAPDQVAAVIMKAIEKDRELRWQSAGEFHQHLAAAAEEFEET